MLWYQHCFHACAGLFAMGSMLLSNSTSWAHCADQEAQPHCIVCNLIAIDEWLQLRRLCHSGYNLVLCRAHIVRKQYSQ